MVVGRGGGEARIEPKRQVLIYYQGMRERPSPSESTQVRQGEQTQLITETLCHSKTLLECEMSVRGSFLPEPHMLLPTSRPRVQHNPSYLPTLPHETYEKQDTPHKDRYARKCT